MCVCAGVCFSYSALAPQLSSSPAPLLLTMLPTCPACRALPCPALPALYCDVDAGQTRRTLITHNVKQRRRRQRSSSDAA